MKIKSIISLPTPFRVRIAAVLFVLGIFASLAAAAEGDNPRRVFVDASSNNFPPMNFLDDRGELAGFGRELADAVMAAVGAEVRHIHSTRWVDVLEWLDSGKADFIHDTGYTQERDAFLDYTRPILEMPERIFVRPDQWDISGLNTLKGKKVACVKKHISHLYLKNVPEIDCRVVNTPVEGLYSLIAGDVDAFVYPEQIVLYLAQNLRLTDKIKTAGDPLRTLTWSMVVKEGNHEMLALLNQGIDKVKQSGAYDRIYDKWWGRKLLAGYSKRALLLAILVAVIAALGLATLIGLLLHNRNLESSKNALAEEVRQRKSAEEHLRRTEARLRQAQKMAKLGHWDWKMATDELIWSDEVYAIFGREKGAFHPTAASFEACIHPEDLADFVTEREAALAEQRSVDIEHRIVLPDGSVRHVHEIAEIVRDPAGNVVRVSGAVQDVTGRKTTEAELLESEERYRMLFENAQDAIFVADPETGDLLDVNRRAEKLTGYSKAELIGQHQTFLHPPGATDFYSEEFKKATQREGVQFLEMKIRTKDGRDVPVEISSGGTVALGEKRLHIGIFRDISQRKASEAALRESEERFALAMKSANDGLFDWNLETHEIFYSPVWKQLLGYEDHEIENRFSEWERLTDPEDVTASWAMMNEVIDGNRDRFEKEFRMRHKDGHWVDILSRANVYRDAAGKAVRVVGTHVDISERKRAEREKRQLEAQLQRAQRMESIGNLAGGIAHDFNNLLFPIVGISEMLMEDLPAGSPEHENACEIFRAGKRGADLVKQILAFSRQSDQKKMPVRIQDVLKEALRLSRATIPSDIEISQEIQSNCGMVMADPTQIHQVAMNLITNAWHALPPSGGAITVGLAETVLTGADAAGCDIPPGKSALLTVSDTGSGIDPAIMDKIFEPYFTTKVRGKGTGLGLAVVYGIVKDHQGDIKVRSEVGKGTAFHVCLPLMKQVGFSETAPAEARPTGTERILVVDDESAVATLEAAILERLGYRVAIHTDSVAALREFEAGPDDFDLVLTDMTMPRMTGDRLAKAIFTIRPDIPIILCTGYSERMDEAEARAMGIKGFLMKPAGRSDMARMVRTVLDGAAPPADAP